MALRDYLVWHDDYDRPGSRLHLRLLVVQDLISAALDAMPDGPVRVISACAGQGRDVITVAHRHRRGADLEGVLVELDPRNVEVAQANVEAANLHRLRVVEADAGRSDAYADAAPADLLVMCGIFGNITDDDIAATIAAWPALCAPGAHVVWTRHPNEEVIERIRGHVADAGFEETALVVRDGFFGVGAARLAGEPRPFEPGMRLFDFVH